MEGKEKTGKGKLVQKREERTKGKKGKEEMKGKG